MYARIRFPSQVIVGLQENLKESRQVLFREQRRRFGDGWPLVWRCRNQVRIRAAHARNQQVPKVADGFTAEVLQIASFFLERMHQSECAVRGPFRNRPHEFF